MRLSLLMSADARAWGGGSWSRSGSVSYTGRYGNTYSRSYSGNGYHYGGYGGYTITAEVEIPQEAARG
jgi:hypothetical protein